MLGCKNRRLREKRGLKILETKSHIPLQCQQNAGGVRDDITPYPVVPSHILHTVVTVQYVIVALSTVTNSPAKKYVDLLNYTQNSSRSRMQTMYSTYIIEKR